MHRSRIFLFKLLLLFGTLNHQRKQQKKGCCKNDTVRISRTLSENLIAELKKENARLADEIDSLKTELKKDKKYINFVENKYYEIEKAIYGFKKD